MGHMKATCSMAVRILIGKQSYLYINQQRRTSLLQRQLKMSADNNSNLQKEAKEGTIPSWEGWKDQTNWTSYGNGFTCQGNDRTNPAGCLLPRKQERTERRTKVKTKLSSVHSSSVAGCKPSLEKTH